MTKVLAITSTAINACVYGSHLGAGDPLPKKNWLQKLVKKRNKKEIIIKNAKDKMRSGGRTYWLEYQRQQNPTLNSFSSTRYIRSHTSYDKSAYQKVYI